MDAESIKAVGDIIIMVVLIAGGVVIVWKLLDW